jgi:hypothetical protein
MPADTHYWRRPGVVFAAFGVLLASAHLASAAVLITLRASPDRLPADGRARAVVTAQVQTPEGRPSPDGTEVTFYTTLGEVVPGAQTVGGIAQVVLTAGTAVGSAVVTAAVGADRQEIEVEFTAAGASAEGAPRVLTFSGGYLAYSVEGHGVVATEGARFTYGRLTLKAAAIQYSVSEGRVRAQGEVTLSAPGATLAGDSLYLDVAELRGALLAAADDGYSQTPFQGESLRTLSGGSLSLEDFAPLAMTDTRTWITAHTITVYTGESVFLRPATIYMDGEKVLSLPHYMVPVSSYGDTPLMRRGGGGFLGQIVGLNSGRGLTFDYPYYLDVSGSQTSVLRLTHNGGNQNAYNTQGWAVGYENQYELSPSSRGTFSLDDVAGQARGLRWQHRLELGAASRADLALSSTQFDPNSPRVATARAQYYQRLNGADLSLSLFGNSMGGDKRWSSTATLGLPVAPIAHTNLGYSVSASVAYGRTVSSGGVRYVAPGYFLPLSSGASGLSETLRFNLHTPSVRLNRRTTLTSGVGSQLSWYDTGAGRRSLDLNLGLRHSFGSASSLSLGYRYGATSSTGGYPAYDSGRQNLTASFFATKPERYYASSFASWDLERNSMFGNMALDYLLPFDREPSGKARWRLGWSASVARFGAFNYRSDRFRLGRTLGQLEIVLNYSPEEAVGLGSGAYADAYGLGYTYSPGRRFWVELTSRPF